MIDDESLKEQVGFIRTEATDKIMELIESDYNLKDPAIKAGLMAAFATVLAGTYSVFSGVPPGQSAEFCNFVISGIFGFLDRKIEEFKGRN